MASKAILIISSSPPQPFSTYKMSSSPPLPLPSEIFTKVPVLPTEIEAAPTPQNANTSFTSASCLLKLDSLQGIDGVRSFKSCTKDDGSLETKMEKDLTKPKLQKPLADKGKGKAAKKPRKTAAKRDDDAIDGAEAKKPRKPRTKKGELEAGDDVVAKEKPPRKSRAKKAQGEEAGEAGDNETKVKAVRKPRAKRGSGNTQTMLSNAQITKVSTSKAGKNGSKKDTAAEVDSLEAFLDYGLAEAVKRRTDWTPPAPTTQTASLKMPAPVYLLDGTLISGDSKTSEQSPKGFQNLFGKFGFCKVESNIAEKIAIVGVGTRKRKLIELVKTNVTASTTTPKTKAPKKKPRTITEQATSAYAEGDDESAKPAPLLQYFSFETTDKVTNDGFKIPPRPRSKSPVKGKKGKAQAPILLSPESALKQVGNQDFVFGTSSQLAREESPGFLRDIHAAMQASNETEDDDPFISSPIRLGGKSKVLSSMRRSLWSAAARDGTGKLLDVEMVDLANSPVVATESYTAALPMVASEFRKEEDGPWHDIEELTKAPTNTKNGASNHKPVGPVETAIRLELSNSPLRSQKSIKSPAKPSTQSEEISPKLATKRQESRAMKISKAKDMEMPNFAAYTLAQLAKEVASYRFKPVKSRDQMIALLEKCWEGKHRLALGALQTNLPVSSPKKPDKSMNRAPPLSQAQTKPPKRGRGRPRKDGSVSPSPARKTKTASVTNALLRARKAQKKSEGPDEISDSDTAETPSPPRRHPSQIRAPPLPLQLSSSSCVETRELSEYSTQTNLYKYINAAIRSAPPSTDSSNPSWHEKILLYDPIILEDLTVWLNTGALEKAGWDGEVDPKEVKKWCESMSICCLWKENLRGGTRNRY